MATRSRRVELAVGIGVVVAGALLAYAMLLAEGVGVRDELMLAAPDAARPGETIALRAYAYHDPDAVVGPTPEEADVGVELRDGAGRVLVDEVWLTPGAGTSREGSLEVPRDAVGSLYLVARARDAQHVLCTVARPLAVSDDAPPAAQADREAAPLSHFSLGSLLPVTPAIPGGSSVGAPGPEAPDPAAPPPPPHVETLDAWVVGGICVPEVRCLLAVDVGMLGVEPQLTECAGVEPLPPLPVTGVATRYFVVPLLVHGPEGTCNLTAVSLTEGSRGAHVAYRSIRFPVALATPCLELESSLVPDGVARWAAVAPPGRDYVVLDVFAAGRWRSTITVPARSDLAAATTYADLALPPLAQGGAYTLQARSDALPTSYVAPRILYVSGPDAGPPEGIPAEAAARAFVLAAREQHGLVLPATVSGLAGDRARLEAQKRRTRTIAFSGIAVGILLLVVAVLRRGLSADAEARAVMVAAGVPGADDTSARRRGRLSVILMVLGLGLALATGAALVAARQLAVDASESPDPG